MRSNIAKHYANRGYNSPLNQMPVNKSPRIQYDVDGSVSVMSGNKNITNTPEGKKVISKEKTDALYAAQDESRSNRSALSIADVSGVSNWGDAKRGAQSLYGMATDPNVEFNGKRAMQDALDIFSAVPVYGKITRAASAFNLAKKGAPTVGTQVTKLVTKGVGANVLSDTASKAIHKSEKKDKVVNTEKKSKENNKIYFPQAGQIYLPLGGVSVGTIFNNKTK